MYGLIRYTVEKPVNIFTVLKLTFLDKSSFNLKTSFSKHQNKGDKMDASSKMRAYNLKLRDLR